MLSLTTMQLLWIVLLAAGFGALLVSGLMLMLLTLGQRDLDDEIAGRKPVHLGDLTDRRRNPDTDRFHGPRAASLMRWQRHD